MLITSVYLITTGLERRNLASRMGSGIFSFCTYLFSNRLCNTISSVADAAIISFSLCSFIMALLVGKGAISVAFVCPSVSRLSVMYIVSNSRTQRLSMPKFGRKVPTLGATHILVSRSRSPVPLMLTHIVRHIFRTARPTYFKLGVFLIRETKCSMCVIRSGRGHTVSAKPGGHTPCFICLMSYVIHFMFFKCTLHTLLSSSDLIIGI